MSAPRIDNHTPPDWKRDSNIIHAGGPCIASVDQHKGCKCPVDGDAGEANARLIQRACQVPHECNVEGCPGPENARKLQAFEGLLLELRHWAQYEDSDGDFARAMLGKVAVDLADLAKVEGEGER